MVTVVNEMEEAFDEVFQKTFRDFEVVSLKFESKLGNG